MKLFQELIGYVKQSCFQDILYIHGNVNLEFKLKKNQPTEFHCRPYVFFINVYSKKYISFKIKCETMFCTNIKFTTHLWTPHCKLLFHSQKSSRCNFLHHSNEYFVFRALRFSSCDSASGQTFVSSCRQTSHPLHLSSTLVRT